MAGLFERLFRRHDQPVSSEQSAVVPSGPPLVATDIIEAARNLARKSRDLMLPALITQMAQMRAAGASEQQVQAYNREQQEARMNVVMDCYLTGCAEMLKRINHDFEPVPWEEYTHLDRLNELITLFGGDPIRAAYCEGWDAARDSAAILCYELGFPELRDAIKLLKARYQSENDPTQPKAGE